jgi:hypothetical protein
MQKIILFLAFVFAVPQPTVAQAANALRQGVRIEVRPVNGKPQTGTLMSLRNDSLLYAPDGAQVRATSAGGAASLAFADVKSVRVSRGRNVLLGVLTKGLIGTGIGAGAGAILFAATYSEPQSSGGWGCLMICSRGATAAVGGVLGGAVGLVVGSIYGAGHGNERWESVELPRQ